MNPKCQNCGRRLDHVVLTASLCDVCDKERQKHAEAKKKVQQEEANQQREQAEWDAVEPMPLEELVAKFEADNFTNDKDAPNGWVATHGKFMEKHHAPPHKKQCECPGCKYRRENPVKQEETADE